MQDVLKRKNPYLFRAKNVLKAQDLIDAITNAHTSSSEEAIFGDWLEGLAIFVNNKVYGGKKSGIHGGIDLEFERDSIRYIVSVKSGPNWGNDSQIKKMVDNFNECRKVLRTSGANVNVIAVNGCCYGRLGKRYHYKKKGDYFKYCGQDFWEFISGEKNLYKSIIEPLGHKAYERNAEFFKSYSEMINKFTIEFINDFCDSSGAIDWDKLIEFNSKRRG